MCILKWKRYTVILQLFIHCDGAAAIAASAATIECGHVTINHLRIHNMLLLYYFIHSYINNVMWRLQKSVVRTNKQDQCTQIFSACDFSAFGVINNNINRINTFFLLSTYNILVHFECTYVHANFHLFHFWFVVLLLFWHFKLLLLLCSHFKWKVYNSLK